jgi:hypothetical protein
VQLGTRRRAPSRVQSFKLPRGIWSRINNRSPSGLLAPLADSCVTCSVPKGHCRYHRVWVPLGTGLTQASRPSQQLWELSSLPRPGPEPPHVPPRPNMPPCRGQATMCPVAPGPRFLAGAGSEADTCLVAPSPGLMRWSGPKVARVHGESSRSGAWGPP